MLAVPDGILRSSYKGTLLRTPVEAIVLTCRNLSIFSVAIATMHNNEWEYKQDDTEGHTTDEQWKMIKQIIDLIIQAVDEATNLSTP